MLTKDHIKTAAVYETLAAFGFTKKANNDLTQALGLIIGAGVPAAGGYYLGRHQTPENEEAAKKQQHAMDLLPILGFGTGGLGYNFGKQRAAREYLAELKQNAKK